MLQKLTLRGQIFDHGVFPTPPSLNNQTITSLYNPLLHASNSDSKITLEKFKEVITKQCSNMTPIDAEVYFTLFKVLTEDDLSFLALRSTQQAKQGPLKENSLFPGKSLGNVGASGLQADFRGLVIFMFLQTFSTSLRYNLDKKEKEFNAQWEPNVFGHFNEAIRSPMNSNMLSQLHSPRSQATRTPLGSEFTQTIQFIRNNIKQILKFVTGDLNPRDNPVASISDAEFNMLQFLFMEDKTNEASLGYPISKYTGLFTGSKANLNGIAEWVTNNISLGDSDVVFIQNMNRSVTVKDRQAFNNKEVRIVGCEDSYIYIDASVQYISIVNCLNTFIFVASVQRVCTVDKCENLTLTVASNFLRIGNSIDSTINYYGSFNPVLYGDNRSITLGPYNANYVELPERIREAGIPLLQKSVDYFTEPLIVNALENSGINYKLQKIEDFSTLVLPDQFKPIYPYMMKSFDPLFFGLNDKQQTKNGYGVGTINEQDNCVFPVLCPNIFREEIQERYNGYKEVHNRLGQLNLDAESQKVLHFTIQSYFKDWLVHTGSLKPIIEMTKMITKE